MGRATTSSDIRNAAQTHLVLTVEVVVLGVLLALPIMSLAAARRPTLRSIVLGVSSVLYTIPSLAAFALADPVYRPHVALDGADPTRQLHARRAAA